MDFKRAIEAALMNARDLLPGAKSFTLEGVLMEGANYEVTLSYYLTGEDPLGLSEESGGSNNLFRLAKLMGARKEYKVFIIDRSFSFKGFKAYKEK